MIAALVRPERCAKVPAASGPNRSERTVVRSLLSCAAVRDSRSVCMYRARRRIAMGPHCGNGAVLRLRHTPVLLGGTTATHKKLGSHRPETEPNWFQFDYSGTCACSLLI